MTIGPEQLHETDLHGRIYVKRVVGDIEQKMLSLRYILINARTEEYYMRKKERTIQLRLLTKKTESSVH